MAMCHFKGTVVKCYLVVMNNILRVRNKVVVNKIIIVNFSAVVVGVPLVNIQIIKNIIQ